MIVVNVRFERSIIALAWSGIDNSTVGSEFMDEITGQRQDCMSFAIYAAEGT